MNQSLTLVILIVAGVAVSLLATWVMFGGFDEYLKRRRNRGDES